MNNIEYINDYDDKMDFYMSEYEDNGKISIITDYETAKRMYIVYGDENYEDYTGIDLQSDVNGYLVEIVEDEVFVIEPIMRNGKYFTIDADELFIEEEFMNDELERFLDCEEVIVISEEFEELDDDYIEDECDEEEIPEEINDLVDGAIENIQNGECLKCTLLDLYRIAYKDGVNSIALDLSNMLYGIIEEV